MIYLKDLEACTMGCIMIKAKTMNSVIFENDVFLFECFFNFQIGDKGDNYIQPDDNDTLRDVTLYIIGYHSEDGVKRMLDYPADATHIISESVEKDMHDAIEKKITE
tara:strand:+ start:334 stop:654 length:321 start_codon:yes stop_codon:yes gene_type:complete